MHYRIESDTTRILSTEFADGNGDTITDIPDTYSFGCDSNLFHTFTVSAECRF